ncbi:hypothetical protein ACROYT_G020963 [Oculina patagonica]
MSSSVALIIGFWTVLFISNALLKNYRKYSRRYKEFLENNGISLSLCQVRWYTTRFNRSFVRFGQFHPYLLHMWFSVGVLVGALLMVASVVILCLTLYKAFAKDAPEQVLTPVMPGVNVPWSQVLYYLVTLTISGVFHEFGHAISAVREQVRVNGFGMFFMAVYPGAFVDLYTEHLSVISPVRQLRIYCAGVWHNAVLVLVGLVFLWSLPYLLVPIYVTGQGAVVFNVLKVDLLLPILRDPRFFSSSRSTICLWVSEDDHDTNVAVLHTILKDGERFFVSLGALFEKHGAAQTGILTNKTKQGVLSIQTSG